MAARRAPAPLPPDVRVERLVAWCEEEEQVVLLVPRFGRGRIGRFLERFFRRNAPIRVRLDEPGSRAWRLLEPGRALGEIAELLEGDPDGGDTAAARLDRFVRRLNREGWIRLFRPDSA